MLLIIGFLIASVMSPIRFYNKSTIPTSTIRYPTLEQELEYQDLRNLRRRNFE